LDVYVDNFFLTLNLKLNLFSFSYDKPQKDWHHN